MKLSPAVATLLALVPVASANMAIKNNKSKAKVLREARKLQNNYNNYNNYNGNVNAYNQNQNQAQAQNYNNYNNYNQNQAQNYNQDQAQNYNQNQGQNYNQNQAQQYNNQNMNGQEYNNYNNYDANGQQQQYYAYQESDEEDAFLGMYSIKMIGCFDGVQAYPQSGEGGDDGPEQNSIAFRLCPAENGCDDDDTYGCDEGYGDYLVGMNTFLDAFFEEQKDNMYWDDTFDVDEYMECREYEAERQEENNNYNNYNNYQAAYNPYSEEGNFYIGPTCTADNKSVKLAVFYDEYCSQESETAFEEISNGWSLPFGNGGLVSSYCYTCQDYDENDFKVREFCSEVYAMTSYSCEEEMSYVSAYGANVNGCEQVKDILPAYRMEELVSEVKSGFGKGFVFLLIVGLLVGAGAYAFWWRKQKENQAAETTTSEGTLA